jgi:hypothetical protein
MLQAEGEARQGGGGRIKLRPALIKFKELSIRHAAYCAVWMLVEAVQRDVFPNETRFHEALNYDSQTTIRFGLHNDIYCCWTRLDYELLSWLIRELLEFFQRELSETLTAFVDDLLKRRKRFWKCSHSGALLSRIQEIDI